MRKCIICNSRQISSRFYFISGMKLLKSEDEIRQVKMGSCISSLDNSRGQNKNQGILAIYIALLEKEKVNEM